MACHPGAGRDDDGRTRRDDNRGVLRLLRTFSWTALRHQPWLGAVAVLAVMLGVALAFSVHLINQSALAEFSSAVRATGGQPDLELRASGGKLDEALFARVAESSRV